MLEYDSANGFKSNLQTMLADLKDQQDLFVIAHSLGGIYALNIANNLPTSIAAALTLATPYGGSSIASFASLMLPYSKLLRDITPTSDVIRSSAEIKISKPWCQVVTTRGNAPWLQTPNDGIITRDSMTARSDIELVEMDTNHYEVVLDPRTVDLIKKLSTPLSK